MATDPPTTSTDGSSADGLSRRERRLGGRIEAFGDIVFGFAISQCALQLQGASGRVDLVDPLRLLLYLATFALLVSLWLTYHRMLSSAYRPAGLDLFAAFAYLALVSLMPYAMYGVSHGDATAAHARSEIAIYSIVFAATMGIATAITARGLRRGFATADAEDRLQTWADLCARAGATVVTLAALVVDLTLGPLASTPVLLAISPVVRIARYRGRRGLGRLGSRVVGTHAPGEAV